MPVFNGKLSEVSFPAGNVYNAGSSPTAYTDLDCSALTGGGQALLIIEINTTNATGHYVRPNGESGTWTPLGTVSAGVNKSYFCVHTDSAGVIEWMTGVDGGNTTVDVHVVIGAQP